MPELERDYYEYGQKVEAYFKDLLDGKKVNETEIWGAWAYALYNDPEVKALFANGYDTYQGDYKRIQSKTNPKEYHRLGKDDRYHPDGWDVGMIWFTDFEITDRVIDIKTAANWRKDEDVQKAKRQAKMYSLFTGKGVKFVVLNKDNFKVQIFTITIKSYDDLFDKMDEFKVAYDMRMLYAKPSYLWCKFCSFAALCDKGKTANILD